MRDRANQIEFDPATGAHLGTRRGEQLDLHLRISEAADPLHFGTFGGRTTRWIWFLFGLLLSALSISGVYLYGLRIARTREPQTRWQKAMQGMGYWKWLAGATVATCLGLAIRVFT